MPPAPPERWASLVKAVRDDHVHGASWLARVAAEILEKCADEEFRRIARLHKTAKGGSLGGSFAQEDAGLTDLVELAWALVWVRPSMAAIANTVIAIWRQALPIGLDDVRSDEPVKAIERLRAAARSLRKSWRHVADELGLRISPLLRDPIFTLSRSGSVEHALVAAAKARPSTTPLEVIVAESLPGGEGKTLAQSLVSAGARVTIVTDSAVGASMTRARTLLLGADSVRSDGALVNKVGSYPAALAATDCGVPVYALCERLKITPPSYPLVLERMPGAIHEAWYEENWLFEVTPARLITAIVTEGGALARDEITRVAANAEDGLISLKERRQQAASLRSGTAHQG